MNEKNYVFKTICCNDFVLIWFSIFISLLFGYIINGGATYILNSELFLGFFDNFITYQIISFLLSLLFGIVLIKYKFEKVNALWIRLLLCIITPLSIVSVYGIIFGNDTITTLMIKMNLDQDYIGELISTSIFVITIISGQIFIKPWRSFLNFALAILYVALMHTFLLFYLLYLAGVLYDNWL